MNYEDMTDFDINKAVAETDKRFNSCIDVEFFISDSNEKAVDVVSQGLLICTVDYCDDVNYAWPIMMKNKITVIDFFNEYIAVHDIQFNDNEHSDSVADWVLEARHENPLRAAMIVFLMIQDEI